MEIKSPELSVEAVPPKSKKSFLVMAMYLICGLLVLCILAYFGNIKYKTMKDQEIMNEVSSLSIEKQMGEVFITNNEVLTGDEATAFLEQHAIDVTSLGNLQAETGNATTVTLP